MAKERCELCIWKNTEECIFVWSSNICYKYEKDWVKVIKYGNRNT